MATPDINQIYQNEKFTRKNLKTQRTEEKPDQNRDGAGNKR